LLDPEYTVYVGAAQQREWFAELEDRLNRRRFHFTPCLGLAWMLAQLESLAAGEAGPLPAGTHLIATVCPQSAGLLDVQDLARLSRAVQELRMPRSVTPDRVFTHETYYLEMSGLTLPLCTSKPETAWSFGKETIVFL
jgi:CRISPR-associated protein Cas5h